jgi:surface polysaccharide O-acyltransferase-like enzyme
MNTELASASRTPRRVHYIDWLRVTALAGVFLFHVLHPFDLLDWHIKNGERSEAITLFLVFLFPWGLGLFFLLAGAGAFFSLGKRRSSRAYLRERGSRLFIPFAVAWVLLSPVQGFFEDVHQGAWTGSFPAYVPYFFERTWSSALEEGFRPLLIGWAYHLWFLVFLLWFGLLGLPIFRLLERPRARRCLTVTAGKVSSLPGATLLLALPIVLVHVAVKAAYPDEHDWGEFAYYFMFFVTGYTLMTDQGFTEAIRRDAWPALVVGVAGFALLMAAGAVEWAAEWSKDASYSWTYAWIFTVFTVQAWAWVVLALSLAERWGGFARPVPGVVTRSAMPFFIFHQPVILGLAFFVVEMAAGIPEKAALLLVSAFFLTAALAIASMRLPLVSRLLGVKPGGYAEGSPLHR